MNRTIQTILNRTSNMDFTDRKVPLSKLNLILEAGKMAPSAMNVQRCNILAVRTKKYVEKLRALGMGLRGRDCFYNANTLILVYGPRDDHFTVQDASCILENMFIASTALGIQSCWINQVDDMFELPEGIKVKKLLGLPDDARVVGTCVVGYSKDGKNPLPKPRKEDFVCIK